MALTTTPEFTVGQRLTADQVRYTKPGTKLVRIHDQKIVTRATSGFNVLHGADLVDGDFLVVSVPDEEPTWTPLKLSALTNLLDSIKGKRVVLLVEERGIPAGTEGIVISGIDIDQEVDVRFETYGLKYIDAATLALVP